MEYLCTTGAAKEMDVPGNEHIRPLTLPHMRIQNLTAFLLCSLCTHAQQWNWAVDAGGTGNTDFCWGIASDSQGNVYLAGSISGPADFGCATLAPPEIAGTLAKYDSMGTCLWARDISTTFDATWAYGVAIDAEDHIYVTGSYDGNATFGNGVTLNSLGGDDIFLARYDTDGNCVWARRAGSNGSDDEARDVAVGTSGDVYITGISGGFSIGFDTISIPNPINYRQVVIACYDSTGAVQWARGTTGNGQGKTAQAIAVRNDRLYITGLMGYTAASYDGLAITPNASSSNLYVLACDLDGEGLWARAFGHGDNEGMGINADTLGNVFVTGRFTGTMVLPTGDPLVCASIEEDIVLMRLDTAGGFHWALRAGSLQRDVGWDVETDGLGNVYVAAHFEQTIDFLGTPLTSFGEEDILLARVDQWGNAQWVKQGGAVSRDVPIAIHRSAVGSRPLYTGGYSWGTVTYGSSTIVDVANGDAMLIQLSDTAAVDFSTAVPTPEDYALQVFPSPATDHIFIRAVQPVQELWLVSALGAQQGVRHDPSGAIDVRALPAGLHLLRAVLADGRVVCTPFVKE